MVEGVLELLTQKHKKIILTFLKKKKTNMQTKEFLILALIGLRREFYGFLV